LHSSQTITYIKGYLTFVTMIPNLTRYPLVTNFYPFRGFSSRGGFPVATPVFMGFHPISWELLSTRLVSICQNINIKN